MLAGTEWLVIFVAILLLFGGQKIPELMRGLGSGIREFNAARSNIEAELREGMREADRKREEEKRLLAEKAAAAATTPTTDSTAEVKQDA